MIATNMHSAIIRRTMVNHVKILHAIHNPSARIVAIADALGVSLDWLFGRE